MKQGQKTSAEQVVYKLRQIEVQTAQGSTRQGTHPFGRGSAWSRSIWQPRPVVNTTFNAPHAPAMR